MKNNTDCKKTEELISLVADSQSFARKNDKLSRLLSKYSGYLGDELSESELTLAVAAKKPDVPKYKQLDKNAEEK